MSAHTPAQPASWRDLIKVHPAADLFPMMSDAELRELGEDIRQNGLKQPIAFYTELRRGRGGLADIDVGIKAVRAQKALELQLIDGRNRLKAMELVGILDLEKLKQIVEAGKIIWRNEISPEAFVVSANIRRRHLGAEQKRELVATLLKANPEQSDRATAKIAQVSDKTVGTVRAALEERAEIPHTDARTDSKGRRQPATKTKRQRTTTKTRPENDVPQKLPGQSWSEAIVKIDAELKKRPADAVDAFVKLCRDRRTQILALPEHRCIALVLAMAEALGFGREDLRHALDDGASP